jgi:hypothetical protein
MKGTWEDEGFLLTLAAHCAGQSRGIDGLLGWRIHTHENAKAGSVHGSHFCYKWTQD